jgi:DNA-binding NtrC family response regulator
MTQPGARVLVVDDDRSLRESVASNIKSWGFNVEQASDGQEALQKLETFAPHLVVTDLMMPRVDGFDLLRELKARGYCPPVIVLSAFGNVEIATQTVHELGAFWFLDKPVRLSALRCLIERAAAQSRMVEEADRLRRQLAYQGTLGNMVGSSPEMQKVFSQILQVAHSSVCVLTTGESGTGKEMVARAIHELSPRRAGPFIAVNCAALPENLVESELFGHEKGAFTDAGIRRQGCFELAEGGTMLLDELGEMPKAAQAKLLRVLEDSRVRRVGGREEITVDVRLIAATNRSTAEMVRNGTLREDLFYRLDVFHIQLPPLRERLTDIRQLAESIISDVNKKHNCTVTGLDDAVMERLNRHSWPGNVRELRNVLERAVIIAGDGMIAIKHLAPDFRKMTAEWSPPIPFGPDSIKLPVGSTVEQVEKALIRMTLDHTRNNKTRAAEILGISSKTLFTRLKEDEELAKAPE